MRWCVGLGLWSVWVSYGCPKLCDGFWLRVEYGWVGVWLERGNFVRMCVQGWSIHDKYIGC